MKNGGPFLKLQDVSKRYVKYDDVPLLVSRLKFRAKNKRSHLWALRHVDLDVSAGETVGIIGRNGSGKSTMLRMLAGVTAPTKGTVSVRGRVSPLISVGVGFHPELTGRENVYVNGAILGMTRREIDRRFDDIIDFSEIAEFVDTPVKFYSSGMFVRLGFSVAVAASPDILLVDEVLAVGDFAFQQKCFDRMAEIQAQGTIVLLVTHNISGVRKLCKRVMVLHDGEPQFTGDIERGISKYHELLSPRYERRVDSDSEVVEMSSLQMLVPDGSPAAYVASGDEVVFRLEVTFLRDVEEGTFNVGVRSDGGQLVYTESTYRNGRRRFTAGEKVRFDARVRLKLTSGSYWARAGVAWGEDRTERKATLPLTFFVSGRPGPFGIADLGEGLTVEGGTPIVTTRADGQGSGADTDRKAEIARNDFDMP